MSARSCWGPEVCPATICDDGIFQNDGPHFKNKFCPCCRERIDLSPASVRALTPELREAFDLFDTEQTCAALPRRARRSQDLCSRPKPTAQRA